MLAPIAKQCPFCSQSFPSGASFQRHRRKAHPETNRNSTNVKVASQKRGPLDTIKDAERAIANAILELEVERQIHHDIVVQIDNKIAKYKKFQNGD